MKATLQLLRGFTIRTRMWGAVLMVLAMFAVVGASVERVEAGTQRVTRAGSTMTNIVGAISTAAWQRARTARPSTTTNRFRLQSSVA
jgi:hypothetical protein